MFALKCLNQSKLVLKSSPSVLIQSRSIVQSTKSKLTTKILEKNNVLEKSKNTPVVDNCRMAIQQFHCFSSTRTTATSKKQNKQENKEVGKKQKKFLALDISLTGDHKRHDFQTHFLGIFNSKEKAKKSFIGRQKNVLEEYIDEREEEELEEEFDEFDCIEFKDGAWKLKEGFEKMESWENLWDKVNYDEWVGGVHNLDISEIEI